MSKTIKTEESTAERQISPPSRAKLEKKGNLMYLGPTIAGAAKHATVFKDGILPERAQECIKELPQMERLFVKVDKAPKAAMEIKKKQSALRTIYDQVEDHFTQ